MVHFVACIWWYIGTRYDTFDPKWVENGSDPDVISRSSWVFGYERVRGEGLLGDLGWACFNRFRASALRAAPPQMVHVY